VRVLKFTSLYQCPLPVNRVPGFGSTVVRPERGVWAMVQRGQGISVVMPTEPNVTNQPREGLVTSGSVLITPKILSARVHYYK